MKIYHNPRCRKSRETLAYITESGKQIEIIEYLKTPPTKNELRQIIALLGITPVELIRKGEVDYKSNFKGKTLSEEEWIDALVAFPKMIERPIVVDGSKAVLGRPPENVKELL